MLYIVSTPIGNLEDITLRALRILKEVDVIAAEDTRHTKKLLTHYDIHTPLISFHQHNELTSAGRIIDKISEGKNIALVCDAGTPSISDPGFKLVRAAIEADIKIEVIPGVSAVAAALSVAGLPTDQFMFVGFLPDKEGKRRTKLVGLKSYEHTLVFYVSKWKLKRVLDDILEIFGDRPVVLCRELTKIHEEVRRNRLSEMIDYIGSKEIKGEVTLVVGGSC